MHFGCSKHLSSLKESLSTTVRHLQHKLKTRKDDGTVVYKYYSCLPYTYNVTYLILMRLYISHVRACVCMLWLAVSSTQDDSEWKQKLAKEKKLTRTLKKSIQKLRTELKAIDRVGKPNKPSKKSVSSFKACIT